VNCVHTGTDAENLITTMMDSVHDAQ